jgi:hypothetical protein
MSKTAIIASERNRAAAWLGAPAAAAGLGVAGLGVAGLGVAGLGVAAGWVSRLASTARAFPGGPRTPALPR